MKNLVFLIHILVSINLFGQTDVLNHHYKQARVFYDKGQYYEAIEEFNICYKISNNPIIAFWLSCSWAKLSNSEKCRKYYLIAKEQSQSLGEKYKKELETINSWLTEVVNDSHKKTEFSGEISGSFPYELEADSSFLHE